jgi:predicted outer membrane repeat protein
MKTTKIMKSLFGAVLPLLVFASALFLSQLPLQAVDFHVATAQDLQNALTLAAANGVNDNIYLTNGYYVGNFNFNSSGTNDITLLPELGLTNTGITLDGVGGGRALNISSSGNGNNVFTVQGITFLRNCGADNIGALRIGAGPGATIVVSGCQFLSPTNTFGMGLEIDSGLNATIINCTAIGSKSCQGGKGISISGVSGNVIVQSCVISTNRVGQGGENINGYGLFVDNASLVTITNCTFSGNLDEEESAGNGAGAYCTGAAIISGNTFIGNAAWGDAGGVFCNGPATLTGNTFASNSATGLEDGGGVFCVGLATLTGNTFTGNWSDNSGGGAIFNSSATLTGNTFTGNATRSTGGGACCNGAATLSGNTFIGNSTWATYSGNGGGGAYFNVTVASSGDVFSDNSAATSGGGAYCNGAATVSGDTFNHNSSTGSGGGIYASVPTISITDSLIEKNTAGAGGGAGIWVNASSNLFLINNTITANNSAGTGGGVAFQVSGVVELLNVFNNIIWGNTATGSGGDVYLTGTGQQKLFEFNDVDSLSGVWDIALNNIDLSPQFFDPVNGDYHTQSTSSCRNAGTNGAPSLPLTDLDGNLRTNNLGQVDLGCYEFNTTATHPADTNGDFVITPAEYAAYAAAWKAGQTWTNAPASAPNPNPIPANFVTRAGYLMTKGGAYYNDGSARPVNWKINP